MGMTITTPSYLRWLNGRRRLKLHTVKVEGNNQEGDDNSSQSKGEHVAHVMSRYAPSRFSRGFDCRDILVSGHPGNRMGIDIGVAALDI